MLYAGKLASKTNIINKLKEQRDERAERFDGGGGVECVYFVSRENSDSKPPRKVFLVAHRDRHTVCHTPETQVPNHYSKLDTFQN